MQLVAKNSPFLEYLVNKAPGEKLPTLSAIGLELGISTGKMREQLEVARSLGLVSVRPKVGMTREAFNFQTAVSPTISFSLASAEATFEQLSQLRQSIEAAFWHRAVALLTETDIAHLQSIIASAWSKLRGEPIHIPNQEHRALHLGIFKQLENPFVNGILAAYWDAYEASELTRFASYTYWTNVWEYHTQIVTALQENEFALGRQLLIEHFTLLRSDGMKR